MTRWLFQCTTTVFLVSGALASAQPASPPYELELTGAIRQARDPVIAHHDVRYYLLTTGPGIPIRCSDDLLHWEGCGLVFVGLPAWAREQVPGATAIWTPRLSRAASRSPRRSPWAASPCCV